jgi:SAM-dependent methyltransferase
LGTLDGGRVLDVGTGRGQFVHDLRDELRGYAEIIGLDISDEGQAEFMAAFSAIPEIRFVVADAMAMPFADAWFDTVAIAGSLHHMAEPDRVLAEMWRVLRTGGALIVYEQIQDEQTEAATTHILFHHWNEEILGVADRPTYRRVELLELVHSVGPAGLQIVEEPDTSDPFEPGRLAAFGELVTERLEQVAGQPDLLARGLAIRQRLAVHGLVLATPVFILGFKP